ncbi:MAG: GNAT family N-acetyltransferase [Clostridia bacterium]|nr:GNAT family N-acetyltransferase [Clostridia bacterium]
MSVVRTHTLVLSDGVATLRPLTDADLPLLHRWNGDEDVLHFSEGDVDPYTPEEVNSLYESLSRTADCFIIETEEGTPIGECRVQPMKSPFPPPLTNTTDCRRIDIVIGEKEFWGKEYGSHAIGLLCRHSFERTSCTHLFAEGILDYNERARKAFEKNGFKVFSSVPAEGDDLPGQMTLFKGSLNKIF